MALTTFVSQNLGAGRADRAKKGSAIGLWRSAWRWRSLWESVFLSGSRSCFGSLSMRRKRSDFGTIHGRTVALVLSSFWRFPTARPASSAAPENPVVPMFTMLICWCGIRVLYVTIATPDHSGLPDDLLGVPADVDAEARSSLSCSCFGWTGTRGFRSLFRAH